MSYYSIRNSWLKLINVRQEESVIVGNFFLHHFFLGLGLALFFTVANTFFLSLFSVDHFPLVFMASAVFMMATGRVYSYFEHHVKIEKLLLWVVLILVALTILFRLSFGIYQLLILPVLLMVGFRIVYLLINLEFWGLSALVFDVRQGKRLFGLISSGDVPAKLLGYASIYTLVPYINLENLLIVGAISFLISYYFLTKILKNTELSVEHAHTPTFSDKNMFQSFFGNDFIISIAVLGFLIVATFTLIEFVFLSGVQSRYSTEKELASFLSIFFAVGYFFTLLFKTILSGRFSDKVGLKNSLMILPSILLIFSVVFVFFGSANNTHVSNLIFIGIMTMVMGVIKYSVNDPVFLVLFQPMPPYLRLKGHSVIKGFVQPAALGLVGFILWLTMGLKGIHNYYYLNFGLILLLVAWIFSVIITNKNYLKTLSDAIRKRFISGANIAVRDTGYYDLLLEKIKSENIQEVAYSISVLSYSNPSLLKKELPKLLHKESELILEYCIDAIKKHKWSEFTNDLHAIYKEHKSESIKAFAVNVYAQLQEDALELSAAEIKSQSFLIQKAIVTGLLAGESNEGRLVAENILAELIHSDKRQDKIEACIIIGELRNEKFTDFLLQFLNDKDDDIVNAAIIAAGKLENDKLIDTLIRLLDTGKWKNEIIYSLSSYSNIINVIEERNIAEPNTDPKNSINILKILDRIKSAESMRLIIGFLTHSNYEVRAKAITVLSSFPLLKTINHSELFTHLVNEEFHLACKLITAKEKEDLKQNILSALDFEVDNIVNRVFTLLGLYYDKEIIRKAEAALQISHKESKANALEILDHLIPKKYLRCLAVLVDPNSGRDKLKHLKSFGKYEGLSVDEFIVKYADKYFSNYTIAVALTEISLTENTIELLKPHLNNENLLIKQSAAGAVEKFQKSRPDIAYSLLTKYKTDPEMRHKIHTTNRLSELEKIIVLKSTALFSDTPENIIAELAAIVGEVVVSKNQLIFKKGDPGSSMYIIYNGEIRIHEEDNTFAILKSLDFFGELALLDPEPRSASATALSDTLLLKINQEDAYELMEDRTEVLKSMMRILCRRIRAQNEKLTAEIDSHHS